MKVALIHDWITGMRGGERCLEAFVRMYPQADIYTLLHVPGTTTKEIDDRVVGTSFFQRIPFAQKFYRLLLPLYPWAIKSLKLRDYDLVISLSHAAAKNVDIPAGAVHVCYCFTPMRYVWDQAYQYFGRITPLLWPVLLMLRQWDRKGSRSVHHFVAISRFIAARIRCYYKRSSVIIYPPVASSWIEPLKKYQKGEAFLYAGALVPYKLPDLVVRAFTELHIPLWIVGDGPERKKLEAMAGENVHFFGRVSDTELAAFYKRSRALLFPGKEDFGIIPIECLAAGRPVIAGYHGALKETLRADKPWKPDAFRKNQAVGVFAKMADNESEQVKSLCEAVEYFLAHEEEYLPEYCVQHAETFSLEQFTRAWNIFLQEYVPQLTEEVDVKTKAAAI